MKKERDFWVDKLRVLVYRDRKLMGRAAAEVVAERIRQLLQSKDEIRMVFAAAPSQDDFLSSLRKQQEVDWTRIVAFHMDEYLGLPADEPQLFGKYLREWIFGHVSFKEIHFIDPRATDPHAECQRYAKLLQAAPIDIVCMGIGENGHIAFNDPGVADFKDPKWVKVVELDAVCRQQQVNDGCFASIEAVPEQAITLTVPALLSADFISVVVPGPTKQEAVFNTLKGAIDDSCPASILRQRHQAMVFLDHDSAAQV